MSRFNKNKLTIYKVLVSLFLSLTLFASSILIASGESSIDKIVQSTQQKADLFSTQLSKEIDYNVSSLTIDNLPKYMNDVLGVEEIEKGKKPVSLSMDNADDLFSLTTINEDGTHSLYIFDTPIKYANGSSIDFIDNTIVNATSKKTNLSAAEKGNLLQKQGYTNKANCFNVSLPENINQGISLEYQNLKVSLFPSSLSTASATLKNSNFRGTTEQVVEYRDVFGAGSHLQYVPTNKGVKENIILDSYKGINTFKFTIKTENYRPLYNTGEAIPFVDETTNEICFILGQADARDSYTGNDSDGHFTLYNSLAIKKIETGIYELTITIDRDFLENKNTVYPVIIDPSITLANNRLYDTTVYSGKPNTQTFYSSSYNIVGYHGTSYGTGIAYLKNTKLSNVSACMDIDPNKIITAYYRAYEGSGKTNSMTIRVYGSSDLWDTTTVTYNNRPEYDNGALTTTVVSKSGWHKFDITRHIRSFLKHAKGTGGYTHERGYTLEATNSSESSKHFCSAEYSGSYTPSVIINYVSSTYDISSKFNSNGQYPFEAWGKLINGQSNLLKIKIPSSGIYVFETMASSYFTGTQSDDTYLELFDSSFNRKSLVNDQSSTNKYARIRISLSAGTYYLMLSAYDSTSKEYKSDNVKCYIVIEKENELSGNFATYANMMYEFYKIGDASTSYNCLGYVQGVVGNPGHSVLWNNHATEKDLFDVLPNHTAHYATLPSGINNCIIAYGQSNCVQHYAKMQNNVITSKIGSLELVMHPSYTAYFNDIYTQKRMFLVNPNAT